MSVRNHSQSLQNDSGKLNLVVCDEGTANIYSNTKTLRFEPVGCIEYGPGSREITINTASTGDLVPDDIVWEAGGVPSSIIPKFATVPNTATVDNAVAHGYGNNATAVNSYAGGGRENTVNTTATNSVVLGGTENNVASGIENTAVVGGTGITGNRSDSLFIGTGGITRASATPANAWEDGNCGNSSQLWFTPTDFLGYQNFGRGTTGPKPLAITDTGGTPWAQIGGGNGPGLFTNIETGPVAGTNIGQLVAIKLLPTGFTTLDKATFYFADVPAWVNSLTVFSTELSAAAYTNLGSIGIPTNATQDVTLGVSASGVGTTSVMVVVDIFTPSGSPMLADQALLGISVDIGRV